MTETTTPTPRLWTPQGFREDEWRHAESVDALGGNAKVILPLEAFLALDGEARERAAGSVGVQILPGEKLDAIVPHLASLPLVSLAFPAFSDGRSYSKALLLRDRYGYAGIVRAAGDVLIDQIPLMLRTGFSEFEVTNETALRRLEEDRLGGIPFHYQPSARPAQPGVRYSWRRQPAV
ncbi:DUF934 domain-containing protein [Aquamicrobium sp. LC103]|uniref:DUF934 domain-containing protein n=1 Tax=Aquamicrobium sp. LC103 TaxID=1120658 RepID=UPI00063E728E|nr:DUF934 domain-containing protein [Aquamicrobium sp. LC103]TKT82672.1 DUF934 domain-containing protein [Aquamicrobium sp. LC103]